MIQTKKQYILLDQGVSGVLLVPENNLNVVIKCYNQYIEYEDQTFRELLLNEKKYLFLKFHENNKELDPILKTLSPDSIRYFNNRVYDFKKELNILKKLKNCSNIIQLIEDGNYKQGVMLGFIMERFPMNLCDWIYNPENKENEYLNKHIVKQLLNGLQQIHQIKCAHLDVKPRNILYDPSRSLIKYCDFGNATFNIPFLFTDCTQGYRAPELFLKIPFDSMDDVFLLDVWSLGCVIYELIFKKMCVNFTTYNEEKITYIIESISSCSTNEIISQLCSKMVTWKKERKLIETLFNNNIL